MRDLLWTQKHFELVAEEIYQYGLIENGFTKKSQFRHGDVVRMTSRLKRRFMSHGLRIPAHDGIKIAVRCGCQHQSTKKNDSVIQRVYVIKLLLHSKGYVLAR